MLACIMVLVLSTQAKKVCRAGRGTMTWYSTRDNQGVIGNRDNRLKVFKSVAVKKQSGVYAYGRQLYIPKLKGLLLPSGARHDGIVTIEDVCVGSGCRYLDIYVGSETQKKQYRRWMRRRSKDPDVAEVVAYTSARC